MPPISGDSSDEESDVPGLLGRGEGVDSSSDDEDSDGIPHLIHRQHQDNATNSDNSESEDEYDDMPGLADHGSRDNSESSSDEMPDLLQRQEENDHDNSSSSSDDSSVPGLEGRGGYNMRQRQGSGSSSSDDDSAERLPPPSRRRRQRQPKRDIPMPPLKDMHKEQEKGVRSLEKQPEVEEELAKEKATKRVKKMSGPKLRTYLEDTYGLKAPDDSEKALLVDIYATKTVQERKASEQKKKMTQEDIVQSVSKPDEIRQRLDELHFSNHENVIGKENLVKAYRHALKYKGTLAKEDGPNLALPELTAMTFVPKICAWVLKKQRNGMKLVYNYIDDSSVIKSTVLEETTYPAVATLLYSSESAFVQYPQRQGNHYNWVIDKVSMEDDLTKKTISGPWSDMEQIVVSKDNFFGIGDTGDTLNITTKDGNVLAQGINPYPASRLLPDFSGSGVWVVCFYGAEFTLGYYKLGTKFPPTTVATISENFHIASDSSRSGVLVLEQHKNGAKEVSRLTHFPHPNTEARRRRVQEIDVDFNQVQSIFDDGSDAGALIHYKENNSSAWKISSVVFGERGVVAEKYQCPKTAQIATNGDGSLWVLKKTGKKGADRTLQFLSNDKSLDLSTKYPAGSILNSAENSIK